MTLLKTDATGAIAQYPYALGDLLVDHPNTSFPLPLDPADLVDFGVHVVAEAAPPAATIEQTLTEAAPALIDGVWTQQWSVTDATPEQIAERQAALVPGAVTMRQARLALMGAGKLATVEAAIDALPEPNRTAARIEWDYSSEVQRHHGLVAALGPTLGMTSEQVDQLFVTAAAL